MYQFTNEQLSDDLTLLLPKNANGKPVKLSSAQSGVSSA
jgi:hypothetical protein